VSLLFMSNLIDMRPRILHPNEGRWVRVMYRRSAASLDSGRPHPGSYRVGQFTITRAGSRWRITSRQSMEVGDFATLGSAKAWCRLDGAPDRHRQNSKQTEATNANV
jgi:hypothetical protein